MAQIELGRLSPVPLGEQHVGMDATEGLYEVHRYPGFYPTSGRELAVSIGAIDTFSIGEGFDEYLVEAVNNTDPIQADDPRNRADAITTEVFKYARKARTDSYALERLDDSLRTIPDLRRSSIRVVDRRDGVGQLVRYYDLRQIAETGEQDTLSFDPLAGHTDEGHDHDGYDPYTIIEPSQPVAARIREVAARVSLAEARETTGLLLDEQGHRYSFWLDKLREAQMLRLVRPVARTALDKLGED